MNIIFKDNPIVRDWFICDIVLYNLLLPGTEVSNYIGFLLGSYAQKRYNGSVTFTNYYTSQIY